MAAPRHVHLIEPMRLGHGPLWLRYMLEAFRPCVERVTVTLPDLAEYREIEKQHPAGSQVEFRRFPWSGDKTSWLGTLESVPRISADLTMLSYLDVVLRRSSGVNLDRLTRSSIWGIWFMPAPRRNLSVWHPSWLTSREYRKQWRRQRIQRRPPRWLSGAWVCDPLLQDRISPQPGQSIHVLPDPWPSRPAQDMGEARRRLGLPEDRRLFLHFGESSERKGLLDAVDAWTRIGDMPNATLVRAGTLAPGQADAMAALVASGRAILHEGYVPDDKLDLYLRACDWLLMPYRFHEGSSGLLSGAAAAARPVIAADYGLIGSRVSRSKLGIVYPHRSIDGLADAIRRASTLRIEDFAAPLRRYSDHHTAEDFIAALRTPLGLAPRGG
jgi:glycosyltransferase involved in cell wall biosynthesis